MAGTAGRAGLMKRNLAQIGIVKFYKQFKCDGPGKILHTRHKTLQPENIVFIKHSQILFSI
jgi:hypothetical protein